MIHNQKNTVFVKDADLEWELTGEGVQRKIMAYDEQLMMVKVKFATGAIGSLHKHIHSQATYIESGVFEVEIESTKKILQAGEVFRIPSNVMHGVVCLEAGTLIDAFSPLREDFLQQ